MASMEHSAGALDDAYAVYADSIQKHVDSLKAAFQDLSQTVISSDVAKFIVDLGTSALTALKNFQEVANVLGGIIPILVGGFSGLLVKTGAIKALATSVLGLGRAFKTLGTIVVSVFTKSFSIASLASLGGAEIAVLVTGITALIAGLYNAFKSFQNGAKSLSELRSEANEAKQEFDEMQSKIDETKSRIKELQQLKADGLITTAEQQELDYLEAQNEKYARQLELLERIAEYKQGRVEQEEQAAAQRQFEIFQKYNDQELARQNGARADGMRKGAIMANQNSVAGLLNALEDYNRVSSELQTVTDELLATPESDTSKMEEYSSRIAELNVELQGYEATLNVFYSRLGEMRTNLTDDESLQQVDEWLNQIDDTLGRSHLGKGFDAFKKDMYSLTKETRAAINTGKKWKDLTEDQQDELSKLGYSAEDAEKYIEQLSKAQENASSSSVQTASSVENLVSLSDEAANAIAMLEALQNALGSDMGAAADQFKKVYAAFKEDWEAGKTGSESVRLAIELFIPESVKQRFHYDGHVLGELLASGIYEAIWGGDNDPATNAANYLREHAEDFGDAIKVIENADGTFSIEYFSIEGMADALGLSVTATEALIANMSEYGMQIGLSREATQNLAKEFGLIEGSLLRASENMDVIKDIIETMAGDGKTGLEIQQTLEMFEKMGLIDLSGAQEQIDGLIATAVLSVDEISKLHADLDKINESGASANEKVQALVNMFHEKFPEADAGTISSWIEQLERTKEIDLSGLSGNLSDIVESSLNLATSVSDATSAIDAFPDKVETEFTDNGTLDTMMEKVEEVQEAVNSIGEGLLAYRILHGLDPQTGKKQGETDYTGTASGSPIIHPKVEVDASDYSAIESSFDDVARYIGQQLSKNTVSAAEYYSEAQQKLKQAADSGENTVELQANVDAARETLIAALQELDEFSAQHPEVTLEAINNVSPAVAAAFSEINSLPSVKRINIISSYHSVKSMIKLYDDLFGGYKLTKKYFKKEPANKKSSPKMKNYET